MRVLSLIFGWFMSVVFLLLAMVLLFSSPLASIPCMAIVLLFLPPARTWLHDKTGRRFPAKRRAILATMLVISIGVVAGLESNRQDHARAAAALEQRISRFQEQKGAVLDSISADISRKEYGAAIAHANRYSFAKDPDIGKLKKVAEQGHKEERRAQIIAELRTVPASNLERNEVLYAELVKLEPGNSSYQSKHEHYATKLAENKQAVASAAKAADYMEQIDRELKSLRTFKIDSYLDTKDNIVIGLALFGAWAKIADEAKRYHLSDAQSAEVARFKSEVARVQRRDFPKIRDAFGPVIRRELWEHDMSARTFGEGYTVIEFVGRTFAANRNIKEWQQSTGTFMRQLRFQQTRYKWYKEADEYTYYDLEGPRDGDLVVWRDDGRYRKL